jgi:hypothetical protein
MTYCKCALGKKVPIGRPVYCNLAWNVRLRLLRRATVLLMLSALRVARGGTVVSIRGRGLPGKGDNAQHDSSVFQVQYVV